MCFLRGEIFGAGNSGKFFLPEFKLSSLTLADSMAEGKFDLVDQIVPGWKAVQGEHSFLKQRLAEITAVHPSWSWHLPPFFSVIVWS